MACCTVSSAVVMSASAASTAAQLRAQESRPPQTIAVKRRSTLWSGVIPLLSAAPLGLAGAARAEDEVDAALAFPEVDASAVLGEASQVLGDALEGASSALDAAAAAAAEVAGGVDLSSTDPVLLVGGAGVVALPLLVSLLFRGKGYAGDVTAEDALEVLKEDKAAVLLDIRDKATVAETGNPKLRFGQKFVQIPFEVEVEEGVFKPDEGFVEKVSSNKNLQELETAVFLLDRFGPESVKAAKDLSKAGFTQVFVIQGGAEGAKGWKESGLAWSEPQAFKLDFSVIKEAIAATAESKDLLPTGLGVAAAVGGAAFVLSEAETALQLIGSAALIQLALKKVLFAEDRKKTLSEIRTFLDTKVAPAGLTEDLKELTSTLLSPTPTRPSMDTPPAETNGASKSSSAATTANGSTNGASAAPPAPAPEPAPVAAAAAAPTAAPETPKSSTDLPYANRPLSPYTLYPGLKPPTSPIPKKP